jgi:hypothetical protein
MKIPQNQFLHSQSFNSDFVEFVWIFPKQEETESWQLICQFRKDGSAYCELGELGNDDDYFYAHAMHMEFPSYIEFNKQNFIHLFDKFFHEGKDLVSLGEDVVKYLESL